MVKKGFLFAMGMMLFRITAMAGVAIIEVAKTVVEERTEVDKA